MLLKLPFKMHMEKRITLNVEGKRLHLVLNKDYDEWLASENNDGNLWDFSITELLDGTIDINEDIWYWLFGDRCYETYEEV